MVLPCEVTPPRTFAQQPAPGQEGQAAVQQDAASPPVTPARLVRHTHTPPSGETRVCDFSPPPVSSKKRRVTLTTPAFSASPVNHEPKEADTAVQKSGSKVGSYSYVLGSAEAKGVDEKK